MARAFQTKSLRPLTFNSGAVAIVIALALLVWLVRETLLLVFAGSLFGIILRTAAEAAHRATRVPIVLCVWLVFALFVLASIGTVLVGGGAFAAQWTQLEPALRHAASAAMRYLQAMPALSSILASFDPASLVSSSGAFLERASGVVNGAVATVIAVLVIIFVAVAGSLEPALYRNGFLALFPLDQRDRLSQTIDGVVTSLRLWLIARAISMCATGLLAWAGLSILRIPLAGVLAVLAAALAFIPNIGAFISAAPAVLIALAINPPLAIAVIVMYWIVHLIDDFAISPFIERRVVRLPPILTLVAQIILTVAAGTLGIMLAAPLVAATIVVVRRLWVDELEGRAP